MNRLNADGHDESQYLGKILDPRSGKMIPIPPINAFRAAKGDIIRNTDDKLESITWMPRRLNITLDDRGHKLIDDDQLHTCKSVERAALSAMAALGLSSIRVFMAGDMNLAGLSQIDPFKAILTLMKPCYSTALLWVICDERNGGNTQLAIKMLGSIHTGISFAKEILDSLQDSGKVSIVALPELRLESEYDPV